MSEARSATLLAKLNAARRLPTPPGIALQVLDLSRREDSDVQHIADAIMSDPALSTRLLKYANSSIVGAGREISSVREAVLVLGLRVVKLTALGFSLMAPSTQPECPEFDLRQFWADSFATAAVARRIAPELFDADREEAFTAGLLAGIGRLSFALGMPDEYSRVLKRVRAGEPLAEVERELLGTNHVELGAQLLEDWGLPEVLVEAVRQQARSSERAQADVGGHTLDQAVQVASRLAPLFTHADELTPPQHDALRDYVENQLELGEETWQRMAGEIASDFHQVAELFDVQFDGDTSVFDLYAEAQEEVTKVGMVAQLERAQALEQNQVLLQRATRDALTGLANRAKLEERLAELVAGTRRDHGQFALLMLDIDHFKEFNDTYGHDAGDRVLKHVAKALFTTLREVDFVARYGGEEFVVLAPCTERRGACIVATRLCKAIERARVTVTADGQELKVTISAGLALTADYDTVPGAKRLLVDADRQLYLSKENGRNTWSYLGRTASKVTVPAPA